MNMRHLGRTDERSTSIAAEMPLLIPLRWLPTIGDVASGAKKACAVEQPSKRQSQDVRRAMPARYQPSPAALKLLVDSHSLTEVMLNQMSPKLDVPWRRRR
jgi:hypothetical protein